MKEALNKGEYYTTIKHGDFVADVYKHETVSYLYVVDLIGEKEQITTAVESRRYKKVLDEIFFNPIANAIWDEHRIFEVIKKDRIVA